MPSKYIIYNGGSGESIICTYHCLQKMYLFTTIQTYYYTLYLEETYVATCWKTRILSVAVHVDEEWVHVVN